MSLFSSKKPYSAVTVAVERLTSEQYEEDDLSGIPDLVDIVKLQSTGPAEAARALRKKLKYGNVHRQLRALTLLDGLIQNAGSRFQRTFIDEPLLERLRVCGTSDLTDQQVRDKCKVLFGGWSQEYKNTPGLEGIAGLYRQLPRKKQPITQEKSKVLRETERDPFEDAADEDGNEPEPSSSQETQASKAPTAASQSSKSTSESLWSSSPKPSKSKKDKKKQKGKAFNLAEEQDKMKTSIAESSLASTNLLNSLQFINREHERVSENKVAVTHFETCKLLRRHVLRYIQHVESEQWLGALINANDQLVTALMTFEQLDSSIDADSDSDDELAEQAHAYRMAADKRKQSVDVSQSFSGLQIGSSQTRPPPPQPPHRQQQASDEDDESVEEDENDPFGDSHVLDTPTVEKGEPRWRVV